MSRWFRHYAGMMRDDKLVRVAVKSKQTVERVTWIWGAILESAAEIDDGGRYEIDHEEISYFLRADVEDIASIEAALAVAGRVADGRVSKWKDRQFQGDRTGGKTRGTQPYVYFIGEAWGQPVKIGFSRNPWSRVLEFQTGSHAKLSVLAAFKTDAASEVDIHTLLSAYRRSGEWFDLPQNATSTIKEAATGKKASYEEVMSTLRRVLRSATITETETELEAKEEKKEPLPETNNSTPNVRSIGKPMRPVRDEMQERFWKAYPSRGDSSNPKAPALEKFVRAVKAGANPEEIIAAAGRYAEIERRAGRAGTEKVAQAVTWLNQRRWQDYAAAPPPCASSPSLIFVARDSPEWLRRVASGHKPGLCKFYPEHQAEGWLFPTISNAEEAAA